MRKRGIVLLVGMVFAMSTAHARESVRTGYQTKVASAQKADPKCKKVCSSTGHCLVR